MSLKCKARTSSWTETWSKLLNGKCFAVYKSIFRPYQTFKIEGFAKIVDGWKTSIFAKRSIPDVWKRSENVEQVYTCRVKKQYSSSKEKILEREKLKNLKNSENLRFLIFSGGRDDKMIVFSKANREFIYNPVAGCKLYIKEKPSLMNLNKWTYLRSDRRKIQLMRQ